MKHKEIILAFISVVFTTVLLTTRNVSMSSTTQTMLIALFTVTALAYGAFVFNEHPVDEREYELSLIASKYAYLAGAGVVTIGIIVQTIDHSLQVWLPIALASMVIAKSMTHYFKK